MSERRPLSLYYYAEEHLSTAIRQLEKVRSVVSRRFHRNTERVHMAQQLLLDTIFLVYSDMDSQLKCSKAHRAQLPVEDQMELNQGFSENILFAAQAIVHGFHIRGIEHCSDELREPALQLCATLEALRHVFRTRSLEAPEPPYNGLFAVLIDFDVAWTVFEQEICRSYFSAMHESECKARPKNFGQLVDLMKRTLHAEVGSTIPLELVEELDPSIMFALPRLTLLSCLLDPSQPLVGKDCFDWFIPHKESLSSLTKETSHLTPQHLAELKTWLASSEPPPNSQALATIFTDICKIVDSLQCGSNSKLFLSALNSAFQN
ncbi:hypothetical protein DSO57_1035224 [Entomophthora muscae]|uniref:Uncharacterized protein n=1 Tax=Entomophthora muscae TaxID=34485 RepID=A0ACC2SCP5_9FUNG|nr:hypothetical protein DSO57_1035224 [Entomophthora muscae]